MIIPSQYFIFISLFIICIYLFLIVVGYKKGFLFEIVSFCYTGISALIAWFVSPVLGNLYPIIKLENLYPETEKLVEFINLDVLLSTMCYFLIVFFVLKILYWFISLIFKGMNKIPVVGKFNQILGAILGIFNATILTLSISLLFTLPVFSNGTEVRNKTILKYVDKYSNTVFEYLIDNMDLNVNTSSFSQIDVDGARQELKNWFNKINNE